MRRQDGSSDFQSQALLPKRSSLFLVLVGRARAESIIHSSRCRIRSHAALDTEGCFVKPSVEAVRFGAPHKKWKGVHLYRQVHMRWAGPDAPGAPRPFCGCAFALLRHALLLCVVAQDRATKEASAPGADPRPAGVRTSTAPQAAPSLRRSPSRSWVPTSGRGSRPVFGRSTGAL